MTFPDNDLTCHVCAARGVNGWHITRCEARRAEEQAVVAQAQAAGVSSVKALDLLAHVRSGRTDDPAAVVAVVLDLGWRPAVGAPDATLADDEALAALERRWSDALDTGCPHCGPVDDCDHIEGYHHALSDVRAALKDAVDHVARVLMAAWEKAEGKPVNPSYVATFADMARAVLAAPIAVTRQSPGGRSLTVCCCDRTTARLVVCPAHPDATRVTSPGATERGDRS